MMNDKKSPLATKREAAEFLSVCERTINRMVSDGQLKTVPFRGLFRVRWSDLRRIASRGVSPVKFKRSKATN